MTPDNIDLDNLKKSWIEMGKSLGAKFDHQYDPDKLSNMKTALDRLRDRYRVFWRAGLIMIFSSFLIFSKHLIVENPLNLHLGFAYAAYFLMCFIMDHWLWKGIGSIDPLRMGVAEVAKKALYYKKRHLQFMIFLIPMAIAILGLTGYVFSSDKYLLMGMITGAICGAILGIFQFRRFMAEYRKLTD